MEALTRIPKVLQTIEDMKNNYDAEKVFTNSEARSSLQEHHIIPQYRHSK